MSTQYAYGWGNHFYSIRAHAKANACISLVVWMRFLDTVLVFYGFYKWEDVTNTLLNYWCIDLLIIAYTVPNFLLDILDHVAMHLFLDTSRMLLYNRVSTCWACWSSPLLLFQVRVLTSQGRARRRLLDFLLFFKVWVDSKTSFDIYMYIFL